MTDTSHLIVSLTQQKIHLLCLQTTPDGLTYKNWGMLTLLKGKVVKKIALDSMALVAKLRTELGM